MSVLHCHFKFLSVEDHDHFPQSRLDIFNLLADWLSLSIHFICYEFFSYFHEMFSRILPDSVKLIFCQGTDLFQQSLFMYSRHSQALNCLEWYIGK